MKNDHSNQADSQHRPKPASGAHQKDRNERIRSRSADPGQSSYGGFKGEDTRRQAQDLGKSGHGEH
ncbi:Uncharacterised protein [Bordetella ansorpii]|uniref:Uncharacterized protein n=1 Tax=Bordetella ansorpii TaxID=288768 RepID=A0A157RP66_9BORD|nr:hypothetical protein [Bordetella ansorpii]SAI59695.1 Uncharacterised protein [Bordetella ansorpii]